MEQMWNIKCRISEWKWLTRTRIYVWNSRIYRASEGIRCTCARTSPFGISGLWQCWCCGDETRVDCPDWPRYADSGHCPNDSLHNKIVSNIQQVKSRGGSVITIVTKGDNSIKQLANYCLEIPEVPECLTPIVASVPLQLLAYHIALLKGKDVDQPRNLTKSVTVE